MYEAYLKKDDDPKLRTFMYVSLIITYILSVFFHYLELTLTNFNIISENQIDVIIKKKITWIIYFSSILIFTYFRFSRNSFHYYEEKYSKCYKLNNSIKIWMLIVFPILFFFLGFISSTFVFGGELFGKEYIGIFNKYYPMLSHSIVKNK
jgi:hypothetical protein